MTQTNRDLNPELSERILEAFDKLNGGIHPGYRPAHAKGILLTGSFRPSAGGRDLTRATHLQREETAVTVRFSDFAGVPAVADNDPNASPRGMAIRFHLGEHVHTDIVAHSANGFPTRTVEEFLEFVHAIQESGSSESKPNPVEIFLGSHPAALRFVQTPKPLPVSYARERFFAVSAYLFTSASGASRFGRYQIIPAGGGQYLSDSEAQTKDKDFLITEIVSRLSQTPARFAINVQLASPEDVVDDSTVPWPEDRETVEFGILEINSVVPNNQAEQQRIIFDPIPRLDGIAPSGDPLLEPRANVYLTSGRRRRSAIASAATV